jgi:predicted PurR-regulated permease PerM
MYTFNSLTTYILLGIVFAFILETSNRRLTKMQGENYVKLNLTARLILILAWPIYLAIFIIELIKNFIQRG